jgi:mannose-6-phosphate isomerase
MDGPLELAMSLYPLTFLPIFKERVWGGRNLERLYRKKLPPGRPIGESWEISDRPGDVSVIANGMLKGKDLQWLMKHHRRDLLGSRFGAERFPLLVKILDARETLSLQVHPPATQGSALKGEPKTELWYIVEADPGAELFAGLKRGVSPTDFQERIAAGTVADCFHRISVKAGDAMFLPSGRVHALGAGLVIFEIQQNSDTTYRVFDWNRVGLDGRPRELHPAESLASIDFEDFEPTLVCPTPSQMGPVPTATLVDDPLFSVRSVELTDEQDMPLAPGSATIVAVLSGALRVWHGTKELRLEPGSFCLVPASLQNVSLQSDGPVKFLAVEPGRPP